jgi:hypothetical protein
VSELKTIADLTPDDRNANVGTERGQYMVAHSLEQYGAGRSVLVDKHGRIIAGNKTVEAAAAMGLEIRVVESDGHTLTVVQRTDLDLDSPEGRALAIADNRAGEVGLAWDAGVLASLGDEGVDLSGLFFPHELAAILEDAGTEILDANALWKGMPDFEQDDLEAYKKTVVHFANEDDYQAFFRLVGQRPNAKAIWFPPQANVPIGAVKDEP